MGLTQDSLNEVIVSSVLLAVTSTILIIRFIGNWVARTPIQLSDVFTGIAWILLIGLVVETILWATIGGNGQDPNSLSSYTWQMFHKLLYANQLTLTALCTCTKLSIVFFYHNVFGKIRRFRLTCLGVSVVVITWGVCVEIATIFQCTPIRALWDSGSGRCVNEKALLYGMGIPNIVFDFVLLLMPWVLIWDMPTTNMERFALLGLFALGAFACAAGIVRVAVLSDTDSADLQYSFYIATIWTLVEPSVALMCASLPVVRNCYNQHKARHALDDPHSSDGSLVHHGKVLRKRPLSLRESFANRVYVEHDYSVESIDRQRQPSEIRAYGSELFRPDLNDR